MKKTGKNASAVEIRNKKASHDYFIGETFEAGIVLLGPEVKSIRSGRASICDAFARANRNGELFLYNCTVAEYEFCDHGEYDRVRPKKLLLHSGELRKISSAIKLEKSLIIPLRMSIRRGFVKVDIAICKGKKLFDKREAVKNREALRDAERAIAVSRRS
jgi:SsrA-binding protein